MLDHDIVDVVHDIGVIAKAADHRISAEAAIERVIPGVTRQHIICLVADQKIITRSPDSVLDQGSLVLQACHGIRVKVGVRHIAG